MQAQTGRATQNEVQELQDEFHPATGSAHTVGATQLDRLRAPALQAAIDPCAAQVAALQAANKALKAAQQDLQTAESPAEKQVAAAQVKKALQDVMQKTTALNTCRAIVCDPTQCVSLSEISQNIRQRLQGKVVGYASFIGRPQQHVYDAYGKARTSANAPACDFTTSTKIPVASVSKVLTTLAAIRVLAQHQVSLDAAIGPYFPSDWSLGAGVGAITFRQLLSNTSGIHNYGNTQQDYADIKQFFAQAIDPTKKTYDYSNYNFSVFRILLPIIDGFVDDPVHRPAQLAAAYVQLVQTHVFAPVGVSNVDCKPPTQGAGASTYAFSYASPGTNPGFDWGDHTLSAGHAGWYLSVQDIVSVLFSLNQNDGRILTPQQWQVMETQPLGWDTTTTGHGYRYVQKNGGWSWNGTSLSTSIALFGAGVVGYCS